MNLKKRTGRLPTLRNIKHAIDNKSGSEAVEMVYSTASLCVLILCSLLILGYALQVNAVSHAGKRVARYIEVSGQANQQDIEVLLNELLPNSHDIDARISISNVNYVNGPGPAKIQIREPFTVNITAKYRVDLLTPGANASLHFDIPIRVKINGQSEIYWKT